MKNSPESLARSSARHHGRTLILWVVAVAAAIFLASRFLGDALTTSQDFTDDPESKRAAALLREAGLQAPDADTEFVLVASLEGDDITGPDGRAFVDELRTEIEALGPNVVTSVGSFLTDDGPISASGAATLLPVTLAGADHAAVIAHADRVLDAVERLDPPAGLEATMAGPATLENETIALAEEGLQQGEAIGILVALVVVVFVFGAVVAGLIPIALGVVAIVSALGMAALIGLAFDLSFIIAQVISMIGLAVGIDYSLFIVSRYREERANGLEKIDAIARTGATASKAVLFSGLTVVLALTGMLLLPNTIFRSIGVGAMAVVVTAVIASLTLLPAVLSLLGDRVDALRIRGRRRTTRDRHDRTWDRIAHAVMRRPVVSVGLAGGVLLLAALPAFGIHEGFSGVSTLPDEAASKRAFLVMEREFSGGLGSPVEIAIAGDITPAVTASIDDLRAALDADPAFGPSELRMNEAGAAALVSAPLDGDIAGDAALEEVRTLRDEVVPSTFGGHDVEVLVGGDTATNVDYLAQTTRYTPLVFLFVLASSFVLLTIAFRSLVIPAKAIVMNLLSVGAAYGLVVLFFQQDSGPQLFKDLASALGFGQVEAIEAGLPLFWFCILFGLSMDYHVFLLSRIRERFDQTGDNTGSVAYGLRTTGALITGAAAIMVAVFAGFAAGPLVGLQQMGFGLAVAVALDATIVRVVLVPATMALLGDRNWYLPSWLRWLPEVHIEGTPEVAAGPDGDQDREEELVPVG
jgi:RND superfamily putative drug exporter